MGSYIRSRWVIERKSTNQLCAQFINEGEKLLEQGKEYEAAEKFLLAQRGAPKSKRLLKIFKEKGVKQQVQTVELDYMRDKKMHELNNLLYFSIDEKEHTVTLEDPGRAMLSP